MKTQLGGVTATERLLSEFCERSFLKLWSYPNPYKDDGHELCDLLAVFGHHVFIFFDRHKELQEVPGKDSQVLWDRWKRNVIDAQVKTAHGAERYIRSGRAIFTDGKREEPFPFDFDRAAAIVHKIIVAHGAKEACEQASTQNIYGSLAISYMEPLTLPRFRLWNMCACRRSIKSIPRRIRAQLLRNMRNVTACGSFELMWTQERAA